MLFSCGKLSGSLNNEFPDMTISSTSGQKLIQVSGKVVRQLYAMCSILNPRKAMITSDTSSFKQFAVKYSLSRQYDNGPRVGGSLLNLLFDRFKIQSLSHTEKKFSGNECMQLS